LEISWRWSYVLVPGRLEGVVMLCSILDCVLYCGDNGLAIIVLKPCDYAIGVIEMLR